MEPMKMCLCFVIDDSLPAEPRVLLGHKNEGLGAGNVVGLGGHLDPGESALQAAIHETYEEAGLVVEAADLEHRASVQFAFPGKPAWDQCVEVFVTTRWQETVTASSEVTPAWHPLDDLPLELMWDDARHWLPGVLSGQRLRASVVFDVDNRTVSTAEVTEL